MTMNFTTQRPDFTCQRCGKCCQEEVGRDMWLGGPLKWGPKQGLLAEREKHPKNEKGCRMLYFKDGISHCLVVEHGNNKRDCNCINYPGKELCLREKAELNNEY